MCVYVFIYLCRPNAAIIIMRRNSQDGYTSNIIANFNILDIWKFLELVVSNTQRMLHCKFSTIVESNWILLSSWFLLYHCVHSKISYKYDVENQINIHCALLLKRERKYFITIQNILDSLSVVIQHERFLSSVEINLDKALVAKRF